MRLDSHHKKRRSVCKQAGVRTVMMTGDHMLTGKSIARNLDIADNDSIALEGADVPKMSEAEFDKAPASTTFLPYPHRFWHSHPHESVSSSWFRQARARAARKAISCHSLGMIPVGEITGLLLVALTALADVLAAGHAILYKRDPRAAVAWTGLVLVFPLGGAVLYFLLGVNRVQRRAAALREEISSLPAREPDSCVSSPELLTALDPGDQHLHILDSAAGRITGRPLTAGNHLDILSDGDEAYPAMLETIDNAHESVWLATYIFDYDKAGVAFADTLQNAVQRGVQVRLLIDAVGSRYSFPSIERELKRRRVPVALFMPAWFIRKSSYLNLRNHRKILVVDGQTGFTGGLNIRHHHYIGEAGRHATRDIHFRLRGPLVGHLAHVFREDWQFTSGEALPPVSPPAPLEDGGIMARAVSDGPDEDYDVLRRLVLCALSTARERVTILTPYFVPDMTLISALSVAALRGVTVDILIPAKSNLRLVDWACMAQVWQLLEVGCRVWRSPPPFDHSKLMLVDRSWALIGSANWDARSFRLNFEFNVETYSAEWVRLLDALVAARRERSKPLTMAEADGRSIPVRLRDGLARLMSPYL